MNINQAIKTAIFEHARQQAPHECCGVLGQRANAELGYFPCHNTSLLPNQFEIDPVDYAELEDRLEIIAIVHSHVNQSAQPSDADRVGCESSGLPWIIVGYPSEEIVTLEPTGYVQPLIGREFVWGIFDCLTLVRDYYRQQFTLLIDVPEDYAYEFWKKGQDLYSRFRQWDFVELSEGAALQVGDVFLIAVLSDIPNHAAVYLGDGVMLHHCENRLSGREQYGGYWQKHTRYVIRHQSLIERPL